MTSLETYLQEMRQARPVAVNETSYYGALSNLFNEVGKTLKPKVRYVPTPKGLGAGIPDGGLYTAQQLKRNEDVSPATTPPERGCVEAKGLKEESERKRKTEGTQPCRIFELEQSNELLLTKLRA